ncbi:MAG TPA: tetratricopeptide repeat protein [Jatrophihabitans sp.]|jgi:tetratricopeptide (TPR) repeat protein|nr:tetratricopeptide repeat protein [Jatrophihabitans sp.]
MTELPDPVLDPDTLHEICPEPGLLPARIEQLRADVRDAPDEIAELLARGELVVLLRISGALDEALHEANAAVDRAEIAGTRAQQHTARVRLAHVHQWRGEFAESNLLFTELLAAAQQFGPVIEAFTRQHAGQNDYDQGHWADARDHFARALAIREELELPERAASQVALAAAQRHCEEGS